MNQPQMLRLSGLPAQHDNQRFKRILGAAGLKCSQPRLKILDVLCECSEQGDALTLQQMHARLTDAEVPISQLCLSQALRRMWQGGLVWRNEAHAYALVPGALDMAEQRRAG
jgi:Fe2+ or Zn2+ uptake regulation protein